MESNTKICKNDPRDGQCDIVAYAVELDNEAMEKDLSNVTKGRQGGLTKTSLEGILEENNR